MLNEKELDDFTNEFLKDAENEGKVGEELKAPEKTGEEEQTLDDGSTVWDNATDSQRNEVKHLQDQLALAQHAAESDKGRNRALHAKVLKMEEDAAGKAVKSTKQDLENESKYTDEEISDMKTDLPEVSAIVSQETADLKKQLAEIQGNLSNNQPDNEDEYTGNTDAQLTPDQEAAQTAEIAKVEAAIPGFQEVVNSVNYGTWLSRQASGVQEMAKSPYADNAITVINMFKTAKASHDPSKELDSMVDTPKKGLSKSTLADNDDFDAQFEHFSKQFE